MARNDGATRVTRHARGLHRGHSCRGVSSDRGLRGSREWGLLLERAGCRAARPPRTFRRFGGRRRTPRRRELRWFGGQWGRPTLGVLRRLFAGGPPRRAPASVPYTF